MRRAQIKAAMESHLRALGFAEGSWFWSVRDATLVILVEGKFRRIKLKAGMPKYELIMQMGRVTGWADILGIQPSKATLNGAGAEHAHA